MKNVARPSLSIFAASRDQQIVSQHRKTKLEGVVVDIYFNSIIPVSAFRMQRTSLLQFCYFLFRDNYLLLANEKNKTFGKYCGHKTGEITWVTGNRTLITFHTGNNLQKRRFLIRLVAEIVPGR